MGAMGRLRILLCPLALAALAAGCGSSKPSSTSAEVSKPGAQVLKDAQRAASFASSVHAAGHGVQAGQTITLDLSITSGSGAVGKFTLFGGTVELIRIGDKLYLRGDRPFWKHFGGNGVKVGLLANRWVVAPASASTFSGFTRLMSMAGFTSQFAVQGKVVNDGVKTYNGLKVIALRDPAENGTLYVRALGKPYPVALVGGKSSATLTFDHWNRPVTLPKPPKNPLSVLGG